MDHFHVALLAGKALDECRRRGQHAIRGHRGRTGLWRARQMK
ncbi:transposase [Pseudarthrobacter sp. SSS035]